VTLCRTQIELDNELDRLRFRGWFREHGVIAQELVPPQGWDLRIIVAGGRVVGAARRQAAPGEWRTNVALGGDTEPAEPPPLARALALSAAAALGADLVGVDLLPTENGFLVVEVNGAVDFRAMYALGGGNVFETVVAELLRSTRERRVLSAVGA
jgi:glutathione synthase/RimK-type ligase-like ATP-grasp enzyme